MQKLPSIIFDFDSTFVTKETLEELANLILEENPEKEHILAHIKTITEQGMNGQIPFEVSLQKRLALFQPTQKSITQLTEKAKDWITPSVQHNKFFFQKNAGSIYIISGGFKEYIVPVVREFGIQEDHVLANSFIFDSKGKYVGVDIKNPLANQGGKARAVQSLNLGGTVCIVGDGYTDYEIKEKGAADIFYAFVENCYREKVVSKADKVIKSIDELLDILNI